MAESGHNLSRNPNVCASCSSMFDGMEERSIDNLPPPPLAKPPPAEPSPPEKAPLVEELRPDQEVVLDWSSGHLSRSTSRTSK